MTTAVRVSTIIPVYNGETTIRAAIDSALAQEFSGQEVIVVNDGSTDSTAAILSGYGDRVNVVTQPNRGPAAARNVGVRIATGEYVAFLDADDLWLAHKLRKCVEALDRNPAAVMAFSDFGTMAADGTPLQPTRIGSAPADCIIRPSFDDIINSRSFTLTSSVVIRRSVLECIGGFCEAFKLGYEDWYLFLQARERGEFVCVREALVRYRTTADDLESAKKYVLFFPDVEMFVRVVNRNYRQPKRFLRRAFVRSFAAAFMIVGLQCLDAGRRRDALRCFATALRCWPAYPLRLLRTERILSRRQARRFLNLVRPNGLYR